MLQITIEGLNGIENIAAPIISKEELKNLDFSLFLVASITTE